MRTLKEELIRLRGQTSENTNQLKTLVTTHFDQYLACHEAVRSLLDAIHSHSDDFGHFVKAAETLTDITDSSLALMVQRAKEQRKLKNALHVLSRFRPILELTSQLKQSLQQAKYDPFVEAYQRLQFHALKSKQSVFQNVFKAVHAIAKQANDAILLQFETRILSVDQQEKVLRVIETLQLTSKPKLICLTKQLDYLENTFTRTPFTCRRVAVEASCMIVAQLRTCLWGLIHQLFEKETVFKGVGDSITSLEAESVQERVWTLVDRALTSIRQNAFPTSDFIVEAVGECFCHLEALTKLPEATSMNERIQTAIQTFYSEFRHPFVVAFVSESIERQREELFLKYFSVSLKTLPSECHARDGIPQTLTKSQLFFIQRNRFLRSVRASVRDEDDLMRLRLSCGDVIETWNCAWESVALAVNVLLRVKTNNDTDRLMGFERENGGGSALEHILINTLQVGLTSLTIDFLRCFLERLRVCINGTDGRKDTAATDSSILLLFIAYCAQIREKWPAVWSLECNKLKLCVTANHTNELEDALMALEQENVAVFVRYYVSEFKTILQNATMEQEIAYCTGSRTNKSVSEPVVPVECRHYVFHILLLIISVKHTIEKCMENSTQRDFCTQTVFYQLTEQLVLFLEREIGDSADTSEWLQIQV